MINAGLRIVVSLSLVLFASASIFSQTTDSPTQLAVEVQYDRDRPPTVDPVDGNSKHGGWFARFPRTAGWVDPPNSLPVTAVNVDSLQAEDGVRVWVSVYLGKVHEEEKQIGSYLLHEGETMTVKELASVGVVPFKLKVVRLAPVAGTVPEFQSKAPSIELVSIEPNFSTMPTVRMVLRNVSAKPVHAVEVVVFQAGRPDFLSMPAGKEGDALVSSGGTFELKVNLITRYVAGANEYSVQTMPNQSVQIASAMFSDGSYEGDTEYAISFFGYQKGHKTQLERVINLLENVTSGDADVASLKQKISALNLEAEPSDVEKLQRQFSGRPIERLKVPIQVGMRRVREDTLKSLTELEIHGRYSGPNAFNTWLTTTKQQYKAWLARL